jgi:RsiW-degrading membrane proteinase PrsW (M82 family)
MSDLDSQAPDPLRTVRAVARAGWPLACLTAVVLGALGFAFRRTESRGDVPTWVLAVTTLLAFIAAAFAALVTYELLRLEGSAISRQPGTGNWRL